MNTNIEQVKDWIGISGAEYEMIMQEGSNQLCLTHGEHDTLNKVLGFVEDNDLADVDAEFTSEYDTYRAITIGGVCIYLDNQADIDAEEDEYKRDLQDEIDYVRSIR